MASYFISMLAQESSPIDHAATLFARSLFAETDDTIITEEVRKFPSRK
jgi:hypothetical protein